MRKALGIDVGGTRIKAAVVNEAGDIVAQNSVPTPIRPEEFRRALAGIVTAMGTGEEALAGVGIACKGVIDWETTRIDRMPGRTHLEGGVLKEMIPLSVPVRADNDARVAMVGEMVWGAARGRKDAILFTLGTGVGGAIVANGKLLRGAGNVAGHLGHTTVMTDGPVCNCGNHGCLESLFSADAISAEGYRAVRAGCVSLLTERFREHPEKITCKDIFDIAAEGDTVAATIRDRAVEHLAAAIAGLCHVLDPEVVILGGQIVEAGDALLGPLTEQIHWRSRWLLRREVPVVLQQIADRSGVTGAAALIFAEAG